MTRAYYRVGDNPNYFVERWVFQEPDPFGFVHSILPGCLVVSPSDRVGFPTLPLTTPVCFAQTVGPDTVTPSLEEPPRDFKRGGDYRIISNRLKEWLEAFDPHAFSFVEIEMHWGGWSDGRKAWLARIVRHFPSLDPAKIRSDAHALIAGPGKHGPWLFDGALRDFLVSAGATGMIFSGPVELRIE